MDFSDTIESESNIKKEFKARSSYVINQILNKVEYISWDIESQPATSEEEEKEGNKRKEQEQVREFINTIIDIFEYHEKEDGNNWIFCFLSHTNFGSPIYNV